MMDVSGSMGDEQKEIVRIESFWIDTWLRSNYKGLETPLHHPRRGGARGRPRDLLPHPRVGRHDDLERLQALHARSSTTDYPPTSGTSIRSTSPTATTGARTTPAPASTLLKGEVLPKVNQFAYGQVESPYGSGQFIKDLREAFEGVENVALTEIANKDAIYASIKDFLGKG